MNIYRISIQQEKFGSPPFIRIRVASEDLFLVPILLSVLDEWEVGCMGVF